MRGDIKQHQKNSKNITLITVGHKGLLNKFDSKFNIVEFGWINDDSLLASLYQACDIFLMPSRQETFHCLCRL